MYRYRFHIQTVAKTSTITLEVYLYKDDELLGYSIHNSIARTGRIFRLYDLHSPLLSIIRSNQFNRSPLWGQGKAQISKYLDGTYIYKYLSLRKQLLDVCLKMVDPELSGYLRGKGLQGDIFAFKGKECIIHGRKHSVTYPLLSQKYQRCQHLLNLSQKFFISGI
jgi:hypothetical protein